MSEVTLAATSRPTQGGSRAATRLRAQDLIPAVVYGRGSDARPVTVARRELRHALTGDAGMNALISLDVEGESLLTIVRDVQRHPVRNTVTHVDFILVSRDEAVTVDVPVVLAGDAVEVHRGDGVVEQQLFTLTVHAKPGAIPNEISVDVAEMTVGDTIRVGDLELPSGVTTDVDVEEPVVVATYNLAAAEVEAADAEAAEEAAEGEPTAEGEAGGAGDAEASDAAEG